MSNEGDVSTGRRRFASLANEKLQGVGSALGAGVGVVGNAVGGGVAAVEDGVASLGHAVGHVLLGNGKGRHDEEGFPLSMYFLHSAVLRDDSSEFQDDAKTLSDVKDEFEDYRAASAEDKIFGSPRIFLRNYRNGEANLGLARSKRVVVDLALLVAGLSLLLLVTAFAVIPILASKDVSQLISKYHGFSFELDFRAYSGRYYMDIASLEDDKTLLASVELTPMEQVYRTIEALNLNGGAPVRELNASAFELLFENLNGTLQLNATISLTLPSTCVYHLDLGERPAQVDFQVTVNVSNSTTGALLGTNTSSPVWNVPAELFDATTLTKLDDDLANVFSARLSSASKNSVKRNAKTVSLSLCMGELPTNVSKAEIFRFRLCNSWLRILPRTSWCTTCYSTSHSGSASSEPLSGPMRHFSRRTRSSSSSLVTTLEAVSLERGEIQS